jgi:hypothetical protein
MAHWRKRNPTALQFNTHLAGWGVALSFIFVTLMLPLCMGAFRRAAKPRLATPLNL